MPAEPAVLVMLSLLAGSLLVAPEAKLVLVALSGVVVACVSGTS
jgi:hypothetical protein